MNAIMGLFSVWGLVTVAFVAVLIYRSRLTSHDRDWIPLSADERAIQAQTVTELKAGKLTWPIRALGAASVVLLLVILSYWVYTGISAPQSE